ncbi:MAG: Trk system potassium transporter TrkA [Nitriliruptorales bacterium]|nr:Trk system potassium transporter TrkA [Nitriliruptorales bacterium]
MRIVIVGAGAVGSYLADRLSTEGQDVVVIENDAARAAEIQENLDALVLTGNGASAITLREAGVEQADLVIAASNSDGVNALACHTAHGLGVDRTVARIEDPDLRAGLEDLGVDVVIDPGEMAAHEVEDLVSQRGVFDVIEFASGRLTLVGGIARDGSPMLGRTIADLRAADQDAEWAVTAVVRGGETIPVRGHTTVRENDHVLMMVATEDLQTTRRLLGLGDEQVERVVILGSTRVGELACDMLLARNLDVVIVDPDVDRCRFLADQHPKALVLAGDPTDPAVLGDLGLVDTDVIAALSGWDEVNLTGCLVGKALGAGTAISRFHRLSYVGLLIGTGIDAAVSSRLSAVNAILRFVRRGRIRSVATFKDTQAEALDIEVEPGSAACAQHLRDLDLPPTAVIGGVVRVEEAFVPTGDTQIREGDRLVVFAAPDAITSVEALCTT